MIYEEKKIIKKALGELIFITDRQTDKVICRVHSTPKSSFPRTTSKSNTLLLPRKIVFIYYLTIWFTFSSDPLYQIPLEILRHSHQKVFTKETVCKPAILRLINSLYENICISPFFLPFKRKRKNSFCKDIRKSCLKDPY